MEWRKVLNGFYEITRTGRVRRAIPGKGARLGKDVKHFIASTGYPIVNLCIGGKKMTEKVHVLIAAAFIGPRPLGMQVNHKNGDKTDFRICNLEYVTRKENAEHAGRMGLVPSGSNHWNWKGGKNVRSA